MATSQPQPLTLAGKVAIVTGGSRGIGAATALELAKRGAQVAITFVSPSSGKLADDIISKIDGLKNGSSAVKIQADMRDLSSPGNTVKETVAAFGTSIDILVNNAGVSHQGPLGQITEGGYADLMDMNVRSVIFMTQAVLPHLRSPARIINIFVRHGPAAVEALTRGWAVELGSAGHTVNAVAPTLTKTDMMSGGEAESALVAQTKMMTRLEHRLGHAEDIVLAVAMVAEPASRWVTGQTIQAGGGIYMC